MRVYLKALGCRLNEAELSQWSEHFIAQGYAITNNPRQADLTIVNTCAVTGEAGRKSRQLIRQLQRTNPAAKTVVSGCYSSLHPDEVSALPGVDLVISNADKDRLVELSRQILSLPSSPMPGIEPDENPLFKRGRSRAFVKVQDGCRYRCTFCIVTAARGEERSRPLADIVGEVNRLYRQGVQEIVLTGVHLGGYGSDIGSSLYTLVETLLKETDVPRVRLGSLEPWDLPEHFFSLFANTRLMPHLHLPLQSGNDKILRKMARRCKTAAFAALAGQARAAIADFSLSTDIIVGFPGETAQDWQQTLQYIESVGFAHLHIFPYSPRAGTRAAELPEQLDKKTKKDRVQALHRLARRMKTATLQSYVGRSMPILWESKSSDSDDDRLSFRGYTPNYLRVAASVSVNGNTLQANTISAALLKRVDDSGEFLLAEPVF